ncbi:HD-GYP domain-containing protein [Pseudorhodoferax sp. Leaf267]|uniref:HD-GYP domain-containing protein n=1 Tax=Pseudorhodoferax sp. Leaf267 TaxID=1736316 RepID=UPI0006F1ED6C|nr:hypothetical protein [Pseudorhodoferax sp. Leaf267]KQP18063.1 phosphodiesterase [Pseudorhodoferax sp. Leaf267]
MQTALPPPQDADYEDLLGLWSDLEAGLDTVLRRPHRIPDFMAKVRQYDRWMQDLLRQDTDIGLYVLFQLAADRSLGYSSAHALICAVLCHVLAQELALPEPERDSLVGAAMTMNTAMTELQNQLADQPDKLDAVQRHSVLMHAADGERLLAEVGVADRLWLDVVARHHEAAPASAALDALPTALRLAHILQVVDRYAAMISPRRTRAGRSVTDTVRAMMTRSEGLRDPVGFALVRAVGLCPPGTFVRMETGEMAVVLRRGAKPNHPLVAMVTNRVGGKLSAPRLHRTASGSPTIQSALTHDLVRNHGRFNHQALVRLGLHAERMHRGS